MNKLPYKKYALALALAVPGSMTFAAGPDFTALTTAVDFGTTTTAILAAAALMAVVYIAMKGARLILGFIRR